MKDDLIRRQAAIDALMGQPPEPHYPSWYAAQIEKLPAAQPEIIRCKDCKHWDGVDTCDVIDAPVWDNDFCSMAERRGEQDETD